MAITVSSGASGRRRFRGGAHAISEINVTPFVDVVLVLLIIFMMTAHVMEFGIELEVPKVRTVKDSVKELAVVNVTRSGQLYLNDKEINVNLLAGEIVKRFGRQPVYLRADKATPWDTVANVMAILGDAKITINAVTQPEDSADRKK